VALNRALRLGDSHAVSRFRMAVWHGCCLDWSDRNRLWAVSKFEVSGAGQSGPRASLADSLKGHGNGADSSLTGGADVLGA
jgi:hypothetical protein